MKQKEIREGVANLILAAYTDVTLEEMRDWMERGVDRRSYKETLKRADKIIAYIEESK